MTVLHPILNTQYGPRTRVLDRPNDTPIGVRRPHMPEARMVELIEAFWHAKGYTKVHAWLEGEIVRSNLLPGALPPEG